MTSSKLLYFSFLGKGLDEDEKDQLDQQWGSMIKNCYSRIQDLSKTLSISNDQMKQHSLAVVWILENKLSHVSTQVAEMQKRRNELRSVSMYIVGNNYRPIQQTSRGYVEEEIEDEFKDIDSEHRLLLERENESLLQKLQGDMEEVVKTTQTLQEISSLQSTLTHHLSAQQEVIESINSDIIESVDYMTNAHKQLKKTERMFGQARIWVFVFLLVASFVLLFLDYYG